MSVIAEVSVKNGYDKYFATGLYERRYPAPNSRMMRLIDRLIVPDTSKVLDFGCGNGRYAIPLLRRGVSLVAYDISAAAIRDLRHHCPGEAASRQLHLVCGDLPELLADPAARDFDLALLMFGVLGHIQQRRRRVETLAAVRRMLAPGGRLVVTVPNARRRFAAEQAAAKALMVAGTLEPGDILYRRTAGTETIDLFYHLYTPEEFTAELTEAGFRVRRVLAESTLEEKAVVRGSALRWLDTILSSVVPVRHAYGFVAIAEAA